MSRSRRYKDDASIVGILLVDKPSGMTSHDVVDRIRRASGVKRVGHTGTLDPAATGLLIICVGYATRLSEHLTGLEKIYEGDMRLGVVTDSYDMDGEVLEENPVPELDDQTLRDTFAVFTGDILQVPPMVSAVKVGGERLYKKARKGEIVEREARPVTVHEFALVAYDAPLATFRVTCSSGTYVRGLCHDAGRRLGCGGVLDSLRRTSVGKHRVANATPVDDFTCKEDVLKRLLPIADALELPEVVVLPSARRLIATGTTLRPKDLRGECPVTEGWVQLKSDKGELFALGLVEQSAVEVSINPKRVFVAA